MFVSIYSKPSLFNAHTMILIVHIFMNVNKLCLNQRCGVVSSTFFFQYEVCATVLYATKAMDRGSRQSRKEELQWSRRDRMNEVTSFTVASVERYF